MRVCRGFRRRVTKRYVFPALREAQRLNPHLSILASPWSPPGWMKTSGTLVGGALRPEAYNAFASYLVKTVQAYAAQGIPVAAITLQERAALRAAGLPWQLSRCTGAGRLLIGRYVGPAFAAAGLGHAHSGVGSELERTRLSREHHAGPGRRAVHERRGVSLLCGRPRRHDPVPRGVPSSSAWVTECSTGAWDLTPFNEALDQTCAC